MLTSLTTFIGTMFMGIAALFGVHNYGNTAPTGAIPAIFETYLSSQQSVSDTSLTIASAALRDGSTLSGYVCLTIDSNTPQLEYECGTLSGTTLTVSVRGIDAVTGTTTINALKFQHRRGADVKITDYPALTIMNNQLNGTQTIPNPLVYSSAITNAQIQANNSNLVNYGLLASTAIAAGVPATPTTLGISKLSTVAASTTNPIVVGDNDVRLTGKSGTLLSSTNPVIDLAYTSTTSSANKVVTTNSSGVLDSSFLDFGQMITGSGADGAVTTAVATTTLTRDMYYTNLTIATGTAIVTNGYRIYATGTVAVSGIIYANGGTAVASTSGIGGNATGTLPATPNGSVGGGGGNGSVGGSIASSYIIGSIGSNGGMGGSGGSGGNNGGTSATSTAVAVRFPYTTTEALNLLSGTTTTLGNIFMLSSAGGSGGGGGGSAGSQNLGGAGGGGGGAGGMIVIYAKTITINVGGTIMSRGGNGGNGSDHIGASVAGSGGGTGGGGAGGVVILVNHNYTNNGSIDVTGGTAGQTVGIGSVGGTSGTIGNNGATGVLYNIKY